MSAWSLFEYHSSKLCEAYEKKVSAKNKSHFVWVAATLSANGSSFAEKEWFGGGNALRNLIAHHGTRVIAGRGTQLLDRARDAFSDLYVDPDGYVRIGHEHAALLKWKIEEFIREPSRPDA
jgi:hypothetical protein